MNVLNWIVNRRKERSTWLGIIGVVTAAGVTLFPEQIEVIATAGAGVASAILAFTSDA